MPRPKQNKSEAVRNYLQSNPDAAGAEVVKALRGQGIKVTSSLVYALKSKAKQGHRAGRKTAEIASTNGMETFLAVLDLARQIGVKNLKEIASRLPE